MNKNRISVKLEDIQLKAMQQYLYTKQKKVGKRLIKSEHIDNETYNKIKQLVEKEGLTLTAVMKDAVMFQLNAMYIITKIMNLSVLPKCSASAFLSHAAHMYFSFDSEKKREEWLKKASEIIVYSDFLNTQQKTR